MKGGKKKIRNKSMTVRSFRCVLMGPFGLDGCEFAIEPVKLLQEKIINKRSDSTMIIWLAFAGIEMGTLPFVPSLGRHP